MERIGKLFVIEGPDGVGKTSTVAALFESLQNNFPDRTWIKMRQPENFRDLIGQTDPENWLKMLYYFMKDREAQLPEIQEHLDNGRHVLLDRYYHSSMVYQSIAANISMESIYNGHLGVDPIILKPNETFLLDAPDDVIEDRIKSSPKKDLDNFDARLSLQREVRKRYRLLHSLPCLTKENITKVSTHMPLPLVVGRVEDWIQRHAI